MKKTIVTLLGGVCMANLAYAQVPTEEVDNISPDTNQSNDDSALTEEPLFTDPSTVPAIDAGQDGIDADQNAIVGENGESIDVAQAPVEDEDGGFLINDANINDIFQLLARRAGRQYFHNNQLNSADFQVTGHLNGDTSPLKQMEELAFQYGLTMYVKGETVYALLTDQLQQLPAKEWTYSLNYLRPTDIEQIGALIHPLLSPGRGIVNYEPKTNTIIVIDTMTHIERIESFLKKIDKPKGQIVIETKIININNTNTITDFSISALLLNALFY